MIKKTSILVMESKESRQPSTNKGNKFKELGLLEVAKLTAEP